VAFVNAGDGGHDLTRRAVSALKGIVVEKCLLHRMQAVALRETLYSRYMFVLRLNGKCEARYDPPSIDVNCACAALTVVTAFLSSGQLKSLSQGVQQRYARLDDDPVQCTIDDQRDV
jgi:hypothetical protein